MPTEPLIRAMAQADLPRVLEIENATQLTPWSEAILQNSFAGTDICMVIENGGQLAGFLMLSSVLDEAEVLDIAIAPEFQRQGLAGKLLSHALDTFAQRGIKVVYLEVRESNLAAQQLYDRLGFNAYGRRPKYYPRGNGHEDALLYMLEL